jgi:hypothetical protein
MSDTFKKASENPAIGHIKYQTRSEKEIKSKYGTFVRSIWKNGKKVDADVMWLGKVLDEEQLIFINRKNGIFRFTPPNIITPLSGNEEDYYKIVNSAKKDTRALEPIESVSFGGLFLTSEILNKSGLTDIFMSPFSDKKGLGDEAMSLMLYKLTHCGAFMHAKTWWEGTYARFLLPNVKLDSPRISEILREIGQERYWRSFFDNYVKFVKKQSPMLCALIDSTGLPNAIQTELTQINNHNGSVSREIRLIAVLDQASGYPLYIKYVPGNIIDKSTLVNIFCEMDAYDISIVTSIFDAGYYTEDNLSFLYNRNIKFVTRHIPNTKLYKQIMENDIKDIDQLKYHVTKDDRLMKIKRIEVSLAGMNLYAYICKDLVEANKSEYFLLKKYIYIETEEKEISEIEQKLRKRGIFVLLSSLEIPTNEILPFYYKRQGIEQIFDFSKNDVDLLPLRTHSEETMRGHLLVVFMATIAHVYMRKILEKSKICNLPRKSITEALNLHATNVYENKNFHVPNVPTPLMRKIYKTFDIDIPSKMSIRGNVRLA